MWWWVGVLASCVLVPLIGAIGWRLAFSNQWQVERNMRSLDRLDPSDLRITHGMDYDEKAGELRITGRLSDEAIRRSLR